MKDEFIYKDGLVYTNDIKDKKVEQFKTYKYQDNVSDILATENIIEDLEKQKKQILKNNEKILNKYLKNNGRGIISGGVFALITFICICILSAITSTFLTYILTSLSALLVYSGVLYFIFEKREIDYKKKNNANSVKLEKIYEEIEKNKELLKYLKNNNSKDLEESYINNNYIRKVNYKEQLIELRELLKLYSKIGYNEKKYNKYYDKGILDKKLRKEYKPEERKLIKDYFKEKNNKNA